MCVALVVHHVRTNRLYVTPTSVGRLSALLERTREVPRGSVARLVRVMTGSVLLPGVDYLLFMGEDGRCLMRASPRFYDERDLATLAGPSVCPTRIVGSSRCGSSVVTSPVPRPGSCATPGCRPS